MLRDEIEKKNQLKKKTKQKPESTWVSLPKSWPKSWNRDNSIKRESRKITKVDSKIT